MSLLDLQDEENLVCGDWSGKLYVWNFNQKKLLFHPETKGTKVNTLIIIIPKEKFASSCK